MWLETQDGNLINLDNVTKIYIGSRKIGQYFSNFERYPTVYAQFSDGNSEGFDSVLFKADPTEHCKATNSWSLTDEDEEEIFKKGREECQLYIDRLFRLIDQRTSMGKSISHEDIAPFVRQQRKNIEE